MDKYKVEIIETLVKVIDVEADSICDAMEKVRDEYYKGDIVLTADNYYDVEFEGWKA